MGALAGNHRTGQAPEGGRLQGSVGRADGGFGVAGEIYVRRRREVRIRLWKRGGRSVAGGGGRIGFRAGDSAVRYQAFP